MSEHEHEEEEEGLPLLTRPVDGVSLLTPDSEHFLPYEQAQFVLSSLRRLLSSPHAWTLVRSQQPDDPACTFWEEYSTPSLPEGRLRVYYRPPRAWLIRAASSSSRWTNPDEQPEQFAALAERAYGPEQQLWPIEPHTNLSSRTTRHYVDRSAALGGNFVYLRWARLARD